MKISWYVVGRIVIKKQKKKNFLRSYEAWGEGRALNIQISYFRGILVSSIYFKKEYSIGISKLCEIFYLQFVTFLNKESF